MLAQTIFFAVFRYLHLLAAIVGIGGTFMLCYVVLPGLSGADETVQRNFHGRARAKLLWIIPGAIGVLLISGIVGLIRAFTVPPLPPVAYHMILGLKLLLAFLLFVVAVMLVLPGNPPNKFQRNRRRWLGFNAHLGFLIVALSVALRFLSGK